MKVEKLRDGLWRWTAPHPAWTPDKAGPEGWDRDVGCLYYEGPEEVVLVDPLVPEEATPDAEKFWRALDGDVARLGRPVVVLITVRWHGRSRDRVRDRYGARVVPCEEMRDGASPAKGVVAYDAGADPGEVVLWIPEHGALVAGDAIVGEGRVRPCPAGWLGEGEEGERKHREVLLPALRKLRSLPIRIVVPSHGAPVEIPPGERLTL